MKTTAVLLVLLLLSACSRSLVNSDPGSLPNQDHLTVLSLNMKGYDPNASREARMQPVVNLCKQEGMDLLLLQEGVSGLLKGSIDLLRDKLTFPASFEAPVFGVWPFNLNNVGIISRYPWLETHSASCEIKMVQVIDNLPIPGKRRVVMGQVHVPGIGQVNAYSVHLASGPTTQEERQKQVTCMLDFINSRPGAVMDILGGDFNFGPDNLAYQMILDTGFQGFGQAPDFVFVRGHGGITEGKIVFTDHFVSDHCGILVKIVK